MDFFSRHTKEFYEVLSTIILVTLVICASVIGYQVWVIRNEHSDGNTVFKSLIEEQRSIKGSQEEMTKSMLRIEQKLDTLIAK